MSTEFVSIHLSATPTARQMKLAREILALVEDTASEAAGLHAEANGPEPAPSKHYIPMLRALPEPSPPAPVGDLSDMPEHLRAGSPERAAAAFAQPGGGVAPVPLAAPIAPVAPVPATPSATPALAPAAVELDTDGLPWDARIHAGTKGKNKSDGRWTGKRGVTDADKVAVLNELRAVYPAPVVAAPPAPIAPVAPVQAPPTLPAAPAVADGPSNGTFVGFMKRIAALQVAGKITPAKVTEFCVAVGIAKIPDLAQPSPGNAKIADVDALITAHLMTVG